ncbi:MAG: hypothetical protein KDA21_06580 [Phycisphaerales bacterium]|nr:hypothetical protein [Phycisphaerales bacterium]
MPRVAIDRTIQRRETGPFAFPLGVYPVEPLAPVSGFVSEFEAADSGDTFGFQGEMADDWEEWPDRFMFDVAITATRLRSLARLLFTLLPGRVYPILDVIGTDAYREIDPFIAYELVGIERFYDAIRMYGDWLFEDGLVGFGAMSVDPFIYVFIDEHKLVTIRAQLDLKERVERMLSAFELAEVEEIRGPDAAEHEHRSVLYTPLDRPEYLSGEDILHRLRYAWRLQLNIDASVNLDDAGTDLGVTAWRCLTRCLRDEQSTDIYADLLLTADCLDTAETLVTEAIVAQAPEGENWLEIEVLVSERVTPERFAELLDVPLEEVSLDASRILALRWVEGDEDEPGEETEEG